MQNEGMRKVMGLYEVENLDNTNLQNYNKSKKVF